MSPLTVTAKDVALDAIAKGSAPALSAAYVGLLTKEANKAVTGVASTGVFTSAAHGYANGDTVVLSGLTGGNGFVAGDLYFVTNSTTNTFTLAYAPAGATITGGTDLSAGTVNRLTEVSGGSPAYARIATAFGTAAAGVSDDSAPHSINVPAAAVVDFVGYYSAVAAGTLVGVQSVTSEVFGGQGTYSITDGKITLIT